MNRNRLFRVLLPVAIGVVLTAFVAGCSSNTTTSAQFSASRTPPTPGLVKLVQKSRSGSRVVVDVLIYGPEAGLDLSAFRFGIAIGDTSVARLVSRESYTQSALVAGAGQSIAIDVNAVTDPSLVQVEIAKQGGGAGNGVPGSSAVVIELPFDVQGVGSTTLTLVGLALNPPQALDSTARVIGVVHFDADSASVRSVTTGGGGY